MLWNPSAGDITQNDPARMGLAWSPTRTSPSPSSTKKPSSTYRSPTLCRCTGISLPGSISAAPNVSCADPSAASKKIARRTPGTTSPRDLSARLVTRMKGSSDTLRRGDAGRRGCASGAGGRDPGEEALRGRDADAEFDRLPRIVQRQLGTGQGRQNLELVERSQVANAE